METIFGDGSQQSSGFLGALMGAGGRLLTGESLFMTVFQNRGSGKRRVAFGAPYPGKIVPVHLAEIGGELLAQKDSFLCAAKGVSVGIAFTKRFGVGLFGGEGFILQPLQGDGLAFIHAGGTILERTLDPGEVLRVDTGCIVTFQPSVAYDIQFVGTARISLAHSAHCRSLFSLTTPQLNRPMLRLKMKTLKLNLHAKSQESPNTSRSFSRRKFLAGTATAATALSVLPRYVLGGARFVAPSEKINIAIVGCGGQGQTNVRALFQQADVQIIAVADPIEFQDLNAYYYRSKAGRLAVKDEIQKHYGEKTPNFKVADYEDFRVMFEKEKALDAILCATPDHAHAYVCVNAMKLGKHVYCEKPLTHNVWEARRVAKVAKETGVATQLGNQGHSGDHIRTTCEIIWDGAIGDVREVHAWTNASRWNRKNPGGMPPEEPVPQGVNWDLWLGPREKRPYSSCYNPVSWRDFWDFGTAPIGDFFCHNFDPALWALDLREPLSIEAHPAGGLDSYMAPVGGLYTYKFGPRGKMPPVTFTWYEGGLMPPRPEILEEDDQLGAGGNGILFVGDKGLLTCPGWAGRPTLLPGSRDASYQRPPKKLPRVKGHHRDWLDACKGGTPSSANFEYGAALTEVGLLGLVAMRAAKKIYWDAKAMKATNAPEADKFIKENYRPGWEVA